MTDGITFKTGFEQIIYDIEQMPSVTPKAEWIPCSERLPEIQQEVILTLRSGVDIGFRGATEPYFYCYGIDGHYVEPQNVLAWMPLPPCYEPQESEDKE